MLILKPFLMFYAFCVHCIYPETGQPLIKKRGTNAPLFEGNTELNKLKILIDFLPSVF